MYSGDVPAILSARKTYSFRGIELTLSCRPLAVRQTSASHHRHPHVRSRSLIRLRDNPTTTTRASLFVSFCPRIAHGIFPLIRGSRAFHGASLSGKICLAYIKSDDSTRFLCAPISATFEITE